MITRVTVIAALLALASPASAATLPSWARDLVSAGPGAAAAAAEVLIDHIDVTIDSGGTMRTTRRYAALIRDRAGSDAAAVRAIYVPGSSSVKSIRAWIAKGTAVRDVDGRAVIDGALVNNDVYNEVRVRGLSAKENVTAGEIFVAELETEMQLLFSQFEWQLQHQWPARLLRRTLSLPPAWRASSVVFNAPALEPRRDGGMLVWERRDVAPLPDEPAMPPPSDIAPRLAISVFAPTPTRPPGQFDSWQAVARWLHGLSEGSSVATPAVVAKARDLTQGATTDFDRAAAIARYVQRVQYISIQTGVGRGGGYQPRAASLVLERNYGDCKDKATLMRAMLAAVGIPSYLASLYSGDRGYVRAEWPSPQQFNHAIIAVAIRVPPDRTVSVIDHPGFGPLVVFDPTDEHTPFGELPIDQQGALALLVHPESAALVRLPLLPADRHATDRTVNGVVAANGVLTASVRERYSGASAATARALRNGLTADVFRDLLARRMAAGIPRARIANIAPPVETTSDHSLAFEVEASGFARDTAGLFLVPMPFELGMSTTIPATADRKTAVLLEAQVINEVVHLQLPAGLVVDAVQKPVRIESPFGRYSLEFTFATGMLQAKRRLEIPLQRIDPAQLPAARAFFERVRRADTDVVVLTRKP
ncbi:MAG TPA: transglutaminase-like domain-containing protein [Vicinamibacterales bacterium]|nr:transglutaminase-like domain-containing protein [Vicinamibacterales bacterium]